jgi:hypothetical protein
VQTSTPAVANATAPIVSAPGRSRSATIATSAATAGRQPAITPASVAEVNRMPLSNSTV